MTIVACFNFAEAFCFATGWPGASGARERFFNRVVKRGV